MDTPDHSGHGQLSEDVVGGHNEALGVVAFSGVSETAFRIEFGADRLRCGRVNFEPSKAYTDILCQRKEASRGQRL